ncbi:MAG: septation protein A [Hyphomicrobiales bacterium]|nr:MAG: septation protein A [Hyphomicrobiales bacterium]
MTDQTNRATPSSGFKFLLDFGPLVVFFATYMLASPVTIGGETYKPLVVAGVVLAVLTVIALAVSYVRYKHIPTMPAVSGVLVVFFVTLSVILNDATFFKIKPTIVYCLFAVALLGGLAFGKYFLAKLFDGAFHLDEAGWRKLTLRWGLFFLVMAVVNEAVWRNFSEESWVTFKTFGFLPLTVIFAIAQVPLMQKHAVEQEEEDGAEG